MLDLPGVDPQPGLPQTDQDTQLQHSWEWTYGAHGLSREFPPNCEAQAFSPGSPFTTRIRALASFSRVTFVLLSKKRSQKLRDTPTLYEHAESADAESRLYAETSWTPPVRMASC